MKFKEILRELAEFLNKALEHREEGNKLIREILDGMKS